MSVTTNPPNANSRASRLGRLGAIRPGHPGLLLAVILTCQLMVVLDATIVNIALPEIKSSLGFTPTGLSWVINAYTLSFGGLLLLGARAGDILGRRRTFIGGLALFTLASLVGGFAGNAEMLLIARAAQGVGAAFASPAALALLMVTYPDGRERTRAVGLYTAVSIGGAAVGLIAGGLLTEWASWRWVLFVNVPIGLVVLALAWRVMVETPRRKGHFDLAGAFTSTLGMTSIVYGLVRAASDGWSDPGTILAFVAGVLLLAAFVVIESRAKSPITPLRLFADRNRSVSYVARLLMVAGMMGMFFFLSQFLQTVLGYGAFASGVAFLPLTIAVFTSSNISARVLTDRFDAKTLMLGGLIISTTGLAWLTQLSATSSYWALLGPLVLFGLGNGTAFVPLTAMALRGVQQEDAGAASGMVNVMQQLGGSVGLAVLVTVFGSASRRAAADAPLSMDAAARAQHAFVVGAQRGFLAATIFLAVTVVLIAVTVRREQPALAETDLDDELRAVESADLAEAF
ncbi:EmrB/QacA subfamily drug resistance transporter [Jatrophihabitans sp. GAS493]|uniref:MFS transporter n=1 Tax=Jatrophihabitans sp. GAS493 TaxID=1907575 RepID=UPI000BB76596|nr:MFS transporter [Jatrophihabitans sp. GAS493]SOD72062.1 EmrB/QacA subfamily drug resistance transporter [Jatrophihabitans sp. GAS493]